MIYEIDEVTLSNGDKMKLYASDLIHNESSNTYGEMREVICVKCGGQKTSQYPEKTKEGMCTLCKGSGKYEIYCNLSPNYMSGD
jgi:hypothetical protein